MIDVGTNERDVDFPSHFDDNAKTVQHDFFTSELSEIICAKNTTISTTQTAYFIVWQLFSANSISAKIQSHEQKRSTVVLTPEIPYSLHHAACNTTDITLVVWKVYFLQFEPFFRNNQWEL